MGVAQKPCVCVGRWVGACVCACACVHVCVFVCVCVSDELTAVV